MADRPAKRRLTGYRTRKTTRRGAVAYLERLEDRCVPASFVLSSLADDGAAGTLRWAILQSNATPEVDTITIPSTLYTPPLLFQPATTIGLNGSQLPTITGTVTIAGQTPFIAEQLVINGRGASRIFHVGATGNLTLVDVALQEGTTAANGGAVLNEGSLTLNSVSISKNRATRGGGIAATAGSTTTATNSTIKDNDATASGGGAWLAGATVRFTDVTISGNIVAGAVASAIDPASGGGVWTAATSTIFERVVIRDNTARGGDSTIVATPSQAGSNFGGVAVGGGLTIAGGAVTLRSSTIDGNTAQGGTGGLGSNGGSHAPLPDQSNPFEITIAKNGGSGVVGGPGGDGMGGGIAVVAGSLSMSGSTISNNVSMGGAGGDGGAGGNGQKGQNATAISIADGSGFTGGAGGAGGHGGEGGEGGPSRGGGIFVGIVAADVTIINSTVAGNEATGGRGGRGGAGGDGGDGGNGAQGALAGGGSTGGGSPGTGGVGGAGGNGASSGTPGSAYGAGLHIDHSNSTRVIASSTIAFNNLKPGSTPTDLYQDLAPFRLIRAAVGKGGTGGLGGLSGTPATPPFTSVRSPNGANGTNGTLRTLVTALAGGGIYGRDAGFGPGTFLVSLKNTIVAANTSNTNTANNIAATLSNPSESVANLIGTGGSGGLVNGVSGNVVGRLASEVGLRPLGNYGGPTQTIALMSNSPAFDAGDNASVATLSITSDQRGQARASGGRVDIGAFELQQSYVVTTLIDEDGSTDPSEGEGVSLREAIRLANIKGTADAPRTITFAPGLTGTINLTGPLPELTGHISIVNPGPGNLTVRRDTGGDYRIFTVRASAQVLLDGLTITNGRVSVGGALGSGIYTEGTLTLLNSVISNNVNRGGFAGGAGIANVGTLTIINSTLTANTANDRGGAVHNRGIATIVNTTIASNSGFVAGGIYNHENAQLHIVNSIAANNVASSSGPDLFNFGTVTGSHNLIERAAGVAALTDQIAGDPKLGPLQDNGGPTMTMALLPGSPAVNVGDNSLIPTSITTDQRGVGFSRFRNGTADLGAFEVQNEPPSISRALPSLSTQEGTTVTNIGFFDDPQGRSTVTLTASRGTVIQDNATGMWTWSDPAPDNTSGLVTITATDDFGFRATATFSLQITNVAPTATILGAPARSPEGTAISLSASVFDPSPIDSAALFRYEWLVTKNGATYATFGTGTTAEFAFTPDDEGTYVVTLTARDKDFATGPATSTTILVENVPPTIALSGNRRVEGGTPYTLTLGDVTDPGADTVSQFIVHWGDGTSDVYSTPGDKVHVYANIPATRILRVDLVDEDGTYTNVGDLFLDPVPFAAGSQPLQIATGDFNRDGAIDLVVSNESIEASVVSVLLNRGDGTFAAPVSYAVGIGPNPVVVGDFNRDGSPDLAVGNLYSNDISVLLNNGDGTFAPAWNYGIEGFPVSLALADFNRDGSPDLAVSAFGTDRVRILFNDGSGGFGDGGSYDVLAISLSSIAAGDFNGDGAPDIAAVAYDSSSLSILTNDGAGGFAFTSYFNTGATPTTVAVGDLNGDNALDLAVGDFGLDEVVLFLNNRSGSFERGSRMPVGDMPSSLKIADLDNNGSPDLAVVGGGKVRLLRNTGSGSFLPPIDYGMGEGPVSLAIADIDGDGVLDLAATNLSAGTVSILNRRTVVVGKAAPLAILSAPTTVVEGQSFEVSLNPTSGFRYSFGTSRDGVTWIDDAPSTLPSRTFLFPDNGTVFIRGRVIDTSGGVGIATRTIVVSNANPTLTSLSVPAGPITVNTPITLSATATDPAAALDPLAFTWTLTDPSGRVHTLNGPSVSFTPTVVGSWSIVLTVTDDDGGSTSSQNASLVVDPLKLTQLSVRVGSTWMTLDPASSRPLPWSNLRTFRLTFNGDASRLTLADITLMGTRFGNYLAGASISHDPSTSSITITLADSAVIGSDAWAARVNKSGDRLVLSLGAVTVSFNVLPGDINGDGVVNLLDVTAVQRASRPLTAYDPFADLNGDGVVDAADLALARRWAGSTLR